MAPRTIHFNQERETKRTVRFLEEGTAVVGTLYVNKEALAVMGNPKRLVVTIDKAD